jgi:hypothetical protein
MFTLRYNRSGAKFKKMERTGLHVMFYYYSACLHLGEMKENFSIHSRNNILGFINTGYFTSDNVPTELRMQRTIDFRISEES